MQYIILCAGKGTRMNDLTQGVPKCLLEYNGKKLIDYKIEILEKITKEIIIVVGYMKDQVIKYLIKTWPEIQFNFVQDDQVIGTGHSLQICAPHVKEKFMVLMGDDVYSAETIYKVAELDRLMVVKKQPDKLVLNGVITNERGCLEKFDASSHLENTGLYVLDSGYFDLPSAFTKNGTEKSIPHTLLQNKKIYPIKIIETDFWKKMNEPEHLFN